MYAMTSNVTMLLVRAKTLNSRESHVVILSSSTVKLKMVVTFQIRTSILYGQNSQSMGLSLVTDSKLEDVRISRWLTEAFRWGTS